MLSPAICRWASVHSRSLDPAKIRGSRGGRVVCPGRPECTDGTRESRPVARPVDGTGYRAVPGVVPCAAPRVSSRRLSRTRLSLSLKFPNVSNSVGAWLGTDDEDIDEFIERTEFVSSTI